MAFHSSQTASMFSGLSSSCITREDDYEQRPRVKEMDFFQSSNCLMNEPKSKEDDTVNVHNNGKRDDYVEDDLKLQIGTGLNLRTAQTVNYFQRYMSQDDAVEVLQPQNHNQNNKDLVENLKEEILQIRAENVILRTEYDQMTCKCKNLQMQLNAKERLDQHNKSMKIHPTETLNHDGAIYETAKQQIGQFLGSNQTTINIDDEDDQRSSKSNTCTTIDNFRDDNANVSKNSTHSNMQRVGPVGVPPATRESQESHEVTMRRARVSVRAHSEANMISDGCQWRKYGQKLAKGNPCPRAYYRCTMGTSCPVRKQVQRCAEDRSILITTYEGHHNHPLPSAAKAMAHTTSSAASMLIAGSKSSSPMNGLLSPSIFSQPTALPGLPSLATISASAPFPTITLDLTRPQGPQAPDTINNVPSSSTNGLGLVGLIQHLLGQAQHNSIGSSEPNLPLVDPLSAAKAALASDPNLASALATVISSMMKGNIESQNVNISNNNSDNSMTNQNGKNNNLDLSNFVEN